MAWSGEAAIGKGRPQLLGREIRDPPAQPARKLGCIVIGTARGGFVHRRDRTPVHLQPTSGYRMGGTIPIRNGRAGDRALCGGEPIRKLSLIAHAKFPQ